jgi:putative acetyltransferase
MREVSWPRLRPATNADCPRVVDLVYTVLREYGLQPDPQCTDADLNDIEQSYLRRGGVFYVLEGEDGSIIGSYGLYPLQPGICELRKMYLHRDHRGQGLGRQMLAHALTRARQLGFTQVTLETAAVLKEAIRLYQSHGFRPYRPDHLSCRCDQAYRLDLTAS